MLSFYKLGALQMWGRLFQEVLKKHGNYYVFLESASMRMSRLRKTGLYNYPTRVELYKMVTDIDFSRINSINTTGI